MATYSHAFVQHEIYINSMRNNYLIGKNQVPWHDSHQALTAYSIMSSHGIDGKPKNVISGSKTTLEGNPIFLEINKSLLSIPENSEFNVSIFPNPGLGMIYTDAKRPLQYQVWVVHGKVIQSEMFF